jgi:hypothetical protein
MSELRSLIDSGITAHAILEPLQSCPADAPSKEMSRLLLERDFDLAGVQEEDGGPVIGFVKRVSLSAGVVRDHLIPLTAEHLISDATPLPSVLSALQVKHHVFVLVGPEVKGILTRTDLNKPPLRSYLLGLISLLEMHFAFWVRAEYPEDTWQDKISPSRMDSARKLQRNRQTRGQGSDLLECLQMGDKRDLLLKRKRLCSDLGLIPKSQALEKLKMAEDLRNLLAHGQQNLVEGSSWEELIALVDWLETIMRKSDDLVEQCAATAAQKRLDSPVCLAISVLGSPFLCNSITFLSLSESLQKES